MSRVAVVGDVGGHRARLETAVAVVGDVGGHRARLETALAAPDWRPLLFDGAELLSERIQPSQQGR
jgi:glucokinase